MLSGRESSWAAKLRLFGSVLAAFTASTLAISSAPAFADLSHPFLAGLSQEGAFHDPCGAATDSEGNLYVAAYQDSAVKLYDASGAFVTEFTPSANAEGPCGIAVDSAGNVYVNGWGTDVVKYNPSSYPPTSTTAYSADTAVNGTGKVVSSGATSVAVDPATQNVYVAQGNHISSYQSNGTLISAAIGSGVTSASYYGVDVLGKNGNVYATDKAHNKAYIFNPAGSTVLVEIDGSESEAGAFSFGPSYPYLAVDQSNGHVYVADIAAHGVVDEFDAAGYFVSGLSHSFQESEPSDIAVDNSGGPNEGAVYVTSGVSNGSVFAFGPLTDLSHPFLAGLSQEGAFHDPCGAATDSEGNLYVAAYQDSAVKLYDASGAFVTEFTPSANAEGPCGIAVDSAGNVYVNGWGTDVVKYNPSSYPPTSTTAYSADTAVNGTGKVVSSGATSVAVDPATQNVYVAQGNHISSYQSNGTLISAAIGSGVTSASYYGVDVLGKNGNVYATDKAHNKAYIFNPAGSTVLVEIDGSESEAGAFSFGPSYPYLAVDQSNGHVYVADIAAHGVVDEFDAAGYFVSGLSHSFQESEPSDIAVDNSGGPNEGAVYVTSGVSNGSVFAFGPLTGGIAPEVEIEPTSEIGISKARFNGAINPRELPNSYHFEWKQGTETGWGGASSSTDQSLPEDSSPHTVSFNATGLAGGATYQVRLVARNTENGLEAISDPDTFATLTPPAPVVSINPPSSITTSSADVSGAVNPQQDFGTTWRLQLSTDPSCASGFADRPLHKLESEADTPTAVSEALTGLLPSQHYCVRIRAVNGGGTTTSETKEFETQTIVPDQVQTAFVAPRLDTSARLNGRVNPEGAKLTYRFEYSEDGGATWIPLAAREDTSEARKQILLAQELEGLAPNTAYNYRFVVEDDAGAASPQGEAKTFITRTTAEVTSPQTCPNEDVRQKQHSDGYLGGCRGIELVNSPDKGNQHLSPLRMTEDGEKALWFVQSGAPGGTASAGNTFLAERTAGGWQSRNLVPPAAQQFGNGNLPYHMENATPDLGAFVFNAGNPTIAIANGKTLIRIDRGQRQDVLASYENPVDGGRSEITDDGAHLLIVNPDTNQLEDIGNPQEATETVSLMPPPGSPLGVPVPGGSPSACGLKTTGESFVGESSNREGAGNDWNPGYRMAEAGDASRVYFEVRPDVNCGAAPYGLYERNRETNATTPIDYGASGRHVEFIRATPDGRSAYFATFSQLDPADQNTGADVYRWDEGTGESSCLTCVVPNADIASFGSGRLMQVVVSADFSHVYFQSKAQLVPGQGEAGAINTYVLSGGEVRFVAGDGVGLLGTSSEARTALSADGNVLVFRSVGVGGLTAQNLTTDRLPDHCTNLDGPAACLELYRYDDRDGSLECISCRHDGETTFSAEPTFQFGMSADGRTVAFITIGPLVARDVNQGLDVYEWRDGVVHLLSDGVGSSPVRGLGSPKVLGIDADGGNILFALTAPGLTGFEQDGLRNLYDARVGGGFPPPVPPAHCAEDSCQGPLQAGPALQGAASANESRGNLVEAGKPRRCAKKRGKARRRCIKRHKRRCAKKRGKARRRCIKRHRPRPQQAAANRNSGRPR